MADHPDYETKGGTLSEGETFARAVENLRLVIKDVYMLGHIANIHHRTDRGDGFIQMGMILEKIRVNLTRFSTTSRIQ